jgi:hypothetical protein
MYRRRWKMGMEFAPGKDVTKTRRSADASVPPR